MYFGQQKTLYFESRLTSGSARLLNGFQDVFSDIKRLFKWVDKTLPISFRFSFGRDEGDNNNNTNVKNYISNVGIF